MRKARSADRVYATPIHVPRVEAGTALARSTSPPRGGVAAAPPVPAATRATGARAPSAAEAALLLLLGSALLALVFAAVPARTLGALSGRLVERRSDIGLAMALTVALAAAAFVVLVGT